MRKMCKSQTSIGSKDLFWKMTALRPNQTAQRSEKGISSHRIRSEMEHKFGHSSKSSRTEPGQHHSMPSLATTSDHNLQIEGQNSKRCDDVSVSNPQIEQRPLSSSVTPRLPRLSFTAILFCTACQVITFGMFYA